VAQVSAVRIIALGACVACSGCASGLSGVAPWVKAHAAEIALVGTVANTVASVEAAASNAITLQEKISKD
jgi:hypothetical protein